MQVRCKGNSAEDLTDEYFQMGYTAKAAFPVTPGNEYGLYGMCIFRGALLFLVNSDDDMPDWCPAVLFEVLKHQFPNSWYFSLYSGERSAVWGFKELATDDVYFNSLTEHMDEAVALFRTRKKQLDEESETH